MKKLLLLLLLTFNVVSYSQFTQNFDAGTTAPAGWTVLNAGGASTFIFGAGAPGSAFSAPNAAQINYDAVAHNDYLVTPRITVTAGVSDRLTYYVKNQDPAYVEQYAVKLSTTTAVAANFTTILRAVGNAPDTWTQFIIDLTPYIGQQVFVGFQAVSTDKFRLLFDNINNDSPPSCEAPSIGSAVVNSTTSATLNWTSTVADVEVLVQAQGAGVPSNIDNTGTNVNGSTLTVSTLTASTNYEFYVRSECTAAFEYSTWSGPYLFNTFPAPNCPNMLTPTNNNTNVALANSYSVSMTWSAASTGSPNAGYNIYLGASATTLVKLNATVFAGTTVNITGMEFNTVYFYQIRAVSSNGTESTNCTTFTFTTEDPFAPYCSPNRYAQAAEPITSVNFAGINQTSPNALATAITHENYTSVTGQVTTGTSYPITLKGNTDGANINRFIVFIDWDQNEVLNDAGEVYFSGTTDMNIVSSTGVDAVEAVGSILVPATALSGTTRMRIKKIFGTTNFTNPCLGADYGQTEDYSLNVTNLATSTFDNASFSAQPNPVKDILNLSYNKNITNVAVFNLLGQVVINKAVNNTESKIDMSELTTGAYMVKVTADNQVKTIKVIKE